MNPLTRLSFSLTILLMAFILPSIQASLFLFLAIVIPLSIWGGIVGKVCRNCLQMALPAAGVLFLIQGLFYPAGQGAQYQVGFMTFREAGLLYAGLISARLLVMAGCFTIFLATTPNAKLTTALQQGGLPASLAYILSAALQLLPEARQRANTILQAQRARGLRTSGSLGMRIRGILPLVAPLVSGTLVIAEERAAALELRAFRSGQKPTSYNEISDSRFEWAIRRLCLAAILVTIGARLWL